MKHSTVQFRDQKLVTDIASIASPEGAALLQVDRMLDDARRIAWMNVFSGVACETVQSDLRAPLEAYQIALKLVGRTLPECLALIDDARYLIWMSSFADDRNSNFGRDFSTAVHRVVFSETAGRPN